MGVSWGVTRSACEPCPEANTEEHQGKIIFHRIRSIMSNIC